MLSEFSFPKLRTGNEAIEWGFAPLRNLKGDRIPGR